MPFPHKITNLPNRICFAYMNKETIIACLFSSGVLLLFLVVVNYSFLHLQTFTGVFIMEMVLKLMALGVREYVKNRWNCFDGTIVVLSVLDLVLSYTETVTGAGLSVLRTFRLVSTT